jgi:Ca2+/H+ antiporter
MIGYLPCSVVASIEETAQRLEISKSFIGLVLLPIVVGTLTLLLWALLEGTCRQMQLNTSLLCGWP